MFWEGATKPNHVAATLVLPCRVVCEIRGKFTMRSIQIGIVCEQVEVVAVHICSSKHDNWVISEKMILGGYRNVG